MSKKEPTGCMAVIYVKHPGPDDENGTPVKHIEMVEWDGLQGWLAAQANQPLP